MCVIEGSLFPLYVYAVQIVQVTSHDEIAVCNLASINVSAFVNTESGCYYDFQALAKVAGILTRNLNKVIDINYYPVPEARNSNLRHRPIGIGIQGLADTFQLLRMPYDSESAASLNEDIAEAIYYGAVEASMQEASVHGPYSSFKGSPASQGLLQFHLRNVQPASGRFDWSGLVKKVQQHGLRNSLLTAQMPTASTSQILGMTESVEAITSNQYSRRTGAGEFTVLNKHMVRDLLSMNMWTPEVRNQLTSDGGSLQKIGGIPSEVKALYKTVWEIKQRVVLDQAVRRSPYVDQSQSTNIFMASPTVDNLTSMHFYGWKQGLKTGMYYLRTQPKSKAIKFTVDQDMLKRSQQKTAQQHEEKEEQEQEAGACTRAMREAGCESCSG